MPGATAPRGDGFAWRDARSESNDPWSCEGGRGLIGADQRHSDTSLLTTSACLSSNMHVRHVWLVSGVLMRWIWLVASTDAMYALGACRFRMGEKEVG